MEIFGIGLPEIMMIAVIALIVVGPDRLPEAARTMGKGIADLRRAIEPARSAWTDLTSEVTNVTNSVTGSVNAAAGAVTGSGAKGIIKSKPGEVATAMTTENPWTVHPIMADMTEQERETFMQGGQVPERILAQMQQSVDQAGSNGRVKGAFPQIVDIDYPMPSSEIMYQPAPPFLPQSEDLEYPAPPNNSDGQDESA